MSRSWVLRTCPPCPPSPVWGWCGCRLGPQWALCWNIHTGPLHVAWHPHMAQVLRGVSEGGPGDTVSELCSWGRSSSTSAVATGPPQSGHRRHLLVGSGGVLGKCGRGLERVCIQSDPRMLSLPDTSRVSLSSSVLLRGICLKHRSGHAAFQPVHLRWQRGSQGSRLCPLVSTSAPCCDGRPPSAQAA